ncbi:THAP domain-containing protein 1-like [Harmonia axyridis]|uniref:THAP domain-containing protein 1-like n=1 Tax=Harmonia axyridis TaxID=115357 RepID=UPI001E276328|nr:THAP domain-containing protein 1-like [Harmonia axyridis]
MVNSCSAYNCTERFKKGSGISFFSFPSDSKLRSQWVLALKRNNFQPSKFSTLCSKHFIDSDIVRDFGKIKLREGTIPSIFDFPEHLKKKTSLPRSHRKRPMKTLEDKNEPSNKKRLNLDIASTSSQNYLEEDISKGDCIAESQIQKSQGAHVQQKNEENPDRIPNQHLGCISKNEQSLDARCTSPSRKKKTVKEEKEVFPDTPPISEVYIQEQNLQQESKIPSQDPINEEFIKIEYLEEYKPTNDTKNDLSIEEIMSDQSELGFSTISSPGIICKRSLSDDDGSSSEQYSSKRQKLNEAREQPKKSSCELFLLSLVPHLESMTDHQQLSFQRQVLQLLEIIKYPQSDRP